MLRAIPRLMRACASADLTVWETASVVARVLRGNWTARNNRELRAQAEYLKLVAR